MKGPAQLLSSGALGGLRPVERLSEWSEGSSSLVLEAVDHKGHRGAVMVYTNPPVHQIGNPGLDAMLTALSDLKDREAEFLLLTWPCDPVHAGGDLKESLGQLVTTHERRDALEAEGAPGEKIEALYDWADGRLEKGQALYRLMRELSKKLRTVGVCGGGLRFGGSAEVNLMADLIVGDSRSGMCFSEAMIGLIPGWAGVGRAVTKAGPVNARWMAETASTVMASDLKKIGIYDAVVTVEEPLPKMERTGDKAADKARYLEALEAHDREIWPRLVGLAADLGAGLTSVPADRRPELLVDPAAFEGEVKRRGSPETYQELFGRPLKEVKDQLKELGRPLAPQSIAELEGLFDAFGGGEEFDEDAFVDAEKRADGRLYRDRRLERGIRATLEQTIPDFREIQ